MIERDATTARSALDSLPRQKNCFVPSRATILYVETSRVNKIALAKRKGAPMAHNSEYTSRCPNLPSYSSALQYTNSVQDNI